MKLSISLPEEDVEALDAYIERTGLASRSAALRRAIRMLRHPELEDNYGNAWTEWADDGDDALWDAATDDGLGNASG